jgi:hypothetical protein
VKGKLRESIDAGASPGMTGTELVVPAVQVNEHERGAEITTISPRQIASGKPTGPRSELGKERSSRNAIRHGIFSEAIQLKGDSRAQFDSLHTGLWEAFRPEGRLEELLVDKLASISWRYRRLLLAETGEIRRQHQERTEQRNKENDEVADSLSG